MHVHALQTTIPNANAFAVTRRRGLTQLQHQMTNLLVLVDTGMEMGLDGAGGEASAAAAAAAAQQNDAVEAAAQLAEREECIAKLEARCRHLEVR